MNRINVLVVDDEPDLRDALEFFLKRRGFIVSTAEDGLKAQEILSQKQFHIVITDIMMPGKNADGITLTKKIRETDPNHNKLIIGITGRSNQTEQELIKAGIDRVVYKPFRMDEIVTIIHDLVNSAAI